MLSIARQHVIHAAPLAVKLLIVRASVIAAVTLHADWVAMSANMASDVLGSSDHSQHSFSGLKASPQARFRDRQKVLLVHPSPPRRLPPLGQRPPREVTSKALTALFRGAFVSALRPQRVIQAAHTARLRVGIGHTPRQQDKGASLCRTAPEPSSRP